MDKTSWHPGLGKRGRHEILEIDSILSAAEFGLGSTFKICKVQDSVTPSVYRSTLWLTIACP